MAKLSQNVARQRMAEALKRMRRGGMTEETMRTTSLGDLFKKSEQPRAAQSRRPWWQVARQVAWRVARRVVWRVACRVAWRVARRVARRVAQRVARRVA